MLSLPSSNPLAAPHDRVCDRKRAAGHPSEFESLTGSPLVRSNPATDNRDARSSLMLAGTDLTEDQLAEYQAFILSHIELQAAGIPGLTFRELLSMVFSEAILVGIEHGRSIGAQPC